MRCSGIAQYTRCKEPKMSINSRQLRYFVAVAWFDPEKLAHYRLDGH